MKYLNEMKGKSPITEKKILTYIKECIKNLKDIGYNIDNDIDFMWGDTTKTFGTMWWPDNKQSNYILVLNKHMINEPEEAIKNTIYHELAHYINNKNLLNDGIIYWYDNTKLRRSNMYKWGKHNSHGQLWQRIADNITNKLGTKISRTDSYQFHTGVGEYAKKQNKYIVRCKNCGNEIYYKKETDFVKNPNISTYDFYIKKYGKSWVDYIWPDEDTKKLKQNTHYWSCGKCGGKDWEVEENK